MIPNDWQRIRLGDLGDEIKDGVRPSTEVEYEMYSVPAFSSGEPDIMLGDQIKSAKRLVAPGDLLLCKINPRINRVWSVSSSQVGRPKIASSEYLVLRLHDEYRDLLPYLVWYLRSPRFRRWIQLNVEGATGSHTRAKSPAILEQEIPIAPPDERDLIVEEIEKQLTRVDVAHQSLNAAQTRLKIYALSVLRAAVTARPSWKQVQIQDVVERVTVGHVGPMKHEYRPEGIPFLRSQNVRPNRFEREGLRFVSRAFHERLKKSALEPGDVVVVRSGNVGTACVIPEALEEANCSDLVVIKKPREIRGKFLAYFLNSVAQRQVAEGTVGVALRHFNTKSVAGIKLAIPSIDEQDAIIARTDRLLSGIDQLGPTIWRCRVRAIRCQETILTRAFCGDLVRGEAATA